MAASTYLSCEYWKSYGPFCYIADIYWIQVVEGIFVFLLSIKLAVLYVSSR